MAAAGIAGVQFSDASFFVWFPSAGGVCFPNRGLVPLGGATANAVESPTSKSSPSEFVVPVVVPGA